MIWSFGRPLGLNTHWVNLKRSFLMSGKALDKLSCSAQDRYPTEESSDRSIPPARTSWYPCPEEADWRLSFIDVSSDGSLSSSAGPLVVELSVLDGLAGDSGLPERRMCRSLHGGLVTSEARATLCPRKLNRLLGGTRSNLPRSQYHYKVRDIQVDSLEGIRESEDTMGHLHQLERPTGPKRWSFRVPQVVSMLRRGRARIAKRIWFDADGK